MGFFELLLVAVLTLLIFGPERMPEATRAAALFLGRLQRKFRRARIDIERQVGIDEIRRQLYNEEIMEKWNYTEFESSTSPPVQHGNSNTHHTNTDPSQKKPIAASGASANQTKTAQSPAKNDDARL